jgi:hypothetical protein
LNYELARQLKDCIDCKTQFRGANRSQRCKNCQAKFRAISRGKWDKKYYRANADDINARIRDYQKTEKGKQVVRATKLKMKELYPEKIKAREQLNDAVKAGRIVKPKECQLCAEDKPLEAHHPDYTKPLEVKWYCNRCHNLMEMSLSELIEACGDVTVVIWGCKLHGYYATSQPCSQEFHEIDSALAEAEGKTPEEAVAKLWLALHLTKK